MTDREFPFAKHNHGRRAHRAEDSQDAYRTQQRHATSTSASSATAQAQIEMCARSTTKVEMASRVKVMMKAPKFGDERRRGCAVHAAMITRGQFGRLCRPYSMTERSQFPSMAA